MSAGALTRAKAGWLSGATLGSLLRASRIHFAQALAVELTYRFALLQQAAGLAVGLAGLIFFWRTAGAAAASTGSYTPAMLTVYFVVASVFVVVNDGKISWAVATAIRMGKLSGALLRPYPYLLSVAAQAAAASLLRMVLLMPPLIAAFWLVDDLRPTLAALDLARIGAFLVAAMLGFVCNILIRMAVGLLAFDLTQTWGPELVFLSFYAVAGGEAYPIDLLPIAWLGAVAWTPVFYMVGFPTLVFLGRIDDVVYAQLLTRGVLVALISAAVVAWMWRRGVRRFEAVGI